MTPGQLRPLIHPLKRGRCTETIRLRDNDGFVWNMQRYRGPADGQIQLTSTREQSVSLSSPTPDSLPTARPPPRAAPLPYEIWTHRRRCRLLTTLI